MEINQQLLLIALGITTTFTIAFILGFVITRKALLKSISTIEEQRGLLRDSARRLLVKIETNYQNEKTINDQKSEIESLKEKIVNVDNLRESDQKKFKQKLEYAINNTPKFKVGCVVKNVKVVEVDVEIKSNLSAIAKGGLASIFGGLFHGINEYFKQKQKGKYFKYKIQSINAHLGQKLSNEYMTEEELISLKKTKTKARK